MPVAGTIKDKTWQRTARPASDYLALQRRYKHLHASDIDALQAEVNEGWARLARHVEMNPVAEVERV